MRGFLAIIGGQAFLIVVIGRTTVYV